MKYLLGRLNIGELTTATAHCATDDWEFHPHYTEGRCPICGWQGQGWPKPVPPWAVALEHVQWDFVGLFVLSAVLLSLGILMARATGILPH
ncbi:MAG: hypothetical protein NVSMB17_09370 [Candidatus Dormibacteria bacterium]